MEIIGRRGVCGEPGQECHWKQKNLLAPCGALKTRSQRYRFDSAAIPSQLCFYSMTAMI